MSRSSNRNDDDGSAAGGARAGSSMSRPPLGLLSYASEGPTHTRRGNNHEEVEETVNEFPDHASRTEDQNVLTTDPRHAHHLDMGWLPLRGDNRGFSAPLTADAATQHEGHQVAPAAHARVQSSAANRDRVDPATHCSGNFVEGQTFTGGQHIVFHMSVVFNNSSHPNSD